MVEDINGTQWFYMQCYNSGPKKLEQRGILYLAPHAFLLASWPPCFRGKPSVNCLATQISIFM